VIIRILFILSATCGIALAQADNNDIEHRIELMLDAPSTYSTTKEATVEWACINKALTNKCLVYHNDQWFYFKPSGSGKLYLNILNQQCKNLKGVQVVIIEGNPCETTSYRLIHCTSFTDQNDTFIELDSLKKGIEYLVLVDGFLGDWCDFDIQFSTQPLGIPVHRNSKDALLLRADQNMRFVNLHWVANQLQLDELSHFEIFRQRINERKAVKLSLEKVITNALGKHIEQYAYVDSLMEPGSYVYRIVGITKTGADRIILDECQIAFYPTLPTKSIEERIIQFPVTFAGEVEIVVVDALKGTALFGTIIKDGQSRVVPLDVTYFVNRGYRFFRIKAIHIKSKNALTQIYALSDEGDWIVVPK